MKELLTLLDGKGIARQVKAEIAAEVENLRRKGKRPPHLAAVLVGNNGASETYVAAKVKACHQVGFDSSLLHFEATISEDFLIGQIHKLNEDKDVDGFIVQLPLPAHISVRKITDAIRPEKDVDGFHPLNLGKMALGLPSYIAATPLGITMLLERYKIETAGKHCVIVGRSNIVGAPMSILMSRNAYPGNCTVTLCHSKTPDIASYTRQADILIAALGKPGFVTAAMVKEGAVVIDVGITRVTDSSSPKGYVIRGDVDFENVAPKCSFITPVPGGVGAMTIVGLLKNTLLAHKNSEAGRS